MSKRGGSSGLRGSPGGSGGLTHGKTSAQTRKKVVNRPSSLGHLLTYNEHEQFADTLQKAIETARQGSSGEKIQNALQKLSSKTEKAITALRELLPYYSTSKTITEFGSRVEELQDRLKEVQLTIDDVLSYYEHRKFEGTIEQRIRAALAASSSEKAQEMARALSSEIDDAVSDLEKLITKRGSKYIFNFPTHVRALQDRLGHLKINKSMINDVSRYNVHKKFADYIEEKTRGGLIWPASHEFSEKVLGRIRTARSELAGISTDSGANMTIKDFGIPVGNLDFDLGEFEGVIGDVSKYNKHKEFAGTIAQKIRDARAASSWPETQSSLEAVLGQVQQAIIELRTIRDLWLPSSMLGKEVGMLHDRLLGLEPPISRLIDKTKVCSRLQEEMKADRYQQKTAGHTLKINSLCIEISNIVKKVQPRG
jgi:hypothetical protein